MADDDCNVLEVLAEGWTAVAIYFWWSGGAPLLLRFRSYPGLGGTIRGGVPGSPS
jgi:hypothetical protein